MKAGVQPVVQEQERLQDVIDYYLQHARTQKKDVTIQREKNVYNNLKKKIGNPRVGDIRYRDLAEYTRKRYKDDQVSPNTIDLEIRKLKQFFNFLKRHDFIRRNPANGLQPPKPAGEQEIRFLTTEEIKSLLKVIDDPDYRDIVLTYLHTGARKSELLADHLSWQDVDFTNRQIHLQGKMDKDRWIPMNDTVYEILHRRKHDEGKAVPFDINYDTISHKFKRYAEAAGFADVSLHTLRRTYGSLLVQNGVDIFTVSKLLGHSSVQVTEKHYAKLVRKNLQQGTAVLDGLIETE